MRMTLITLSAIQGKTQHINAFFYRIIGRQWQQLDARFQIYRRERKKKENLQSFQPRVSADKVKKKTRQKKPLQLFLKLKFPSQINQTRTRTGMMMKRKKRKRKVSWSHLRHVLGTLSMWTMMSHPSPSPFCFLCRPTSGLVWTATSPSSTPAPLVWTASSSRWWWWRQV